MKLKPGSHLPHILPLEGQEKMCNPFHPSFYEYLFITLTKACRWEQLQSQHITIFPRSFVFSIGKIVQDESLAEKYIFVTTS